VESYLSIEPPADIDASFDQRSKKFDADPKQAALNS
jgi:hypothetical protein